LRSSQAILARPFLKNKTNKRDGGVAPETEHRERPWDHPRATESISSRITLLVRGRIKFRYKFRALGECLIILLYFFSLNPAIYWP
jgi:hypothetical protein